MPFNVIAEPQRYIGSRSTGNPAARTAPCYAVDVSPFAGKTAEVRSEFRSPGYHDFSGGPRFYPAPPNATSQVLDDLRFSSAAAVPEPGTRALFALGGAALGWKNRRR